MKLTLNGVELSVAPFSPVHCALWIKPITSVAKPTSSEWAALDSLLISPSRQFLNRDDIGIILINQYIAEMVRHALDAHQRSIPAVLEIPSKEHPYDAAKDSILRRARGMFTAEDLR